MKNQITSFIVHKLNILFVLSTHNYKKFGLSNQNIYSFNGTDVMWNTLISTFKWYYNLSQKQLFASNQIVSCFYII